MPADMVGQAGFDSALFAYLFQDIITATVACLALLSDFCFAVLFLIPSDLVRFYLTGRYLSGEILLCQEFR